MPTSNVLHRDPAIKLVKKDELLCGVFGATRTRKPRTTEGRIVGLKLTKKDEVLCGVFGAGRVRKPRTTEGRIVGLKLTDEDNGASDDPKFTGAEGECTPQAVNCYIDEDHDQQ